MIATELKNKISLGVGNGQNLSISVILYHGNSIDDSAVIFFCKFKFKMVLNNHILPHHF